MQIVEPSAELLFVTPDANILIEQAGRTCYKSEEKITDNSSSKFLQQIIKSGHESVLEHASASFRIITNRYTTHQIVRHRLFSYSQESQRYCNYSKDKFNKGIQYVLPKCEMSENVLENFLASLQSCEDTYLFLIDQGVAPQVARAVLPSCCKTEIVMSGNFRSWRHFFKLRCDLHAQADVRFLANTMVQQFQEILPEVFSSEALEI